MEGRQLPKYLVDEEERKEGRVYTSILVMTPRTWVDEEGEQHRCHFVRQHAWHTSHTTHIHTHTHTTMRTGHGTQDTGHIPYRVGVLVSLLFSPLLDVRPGLPNNLLTPYSSLSSSSLLFSTYDPVSVFSSLRRGQVRMDVLSVYLVTPTITAVPPVPTESKTWAYLRDGGRHTSGTIEDIPAVRLVIQVGGGEHVCQYSYIEVLCGCTVWDGG